MNSFQILEEPSRQKNQMPPPLFTKLYQIVVNYRQLLKRQFS